MKTFLLALLLMPLTGFAHSKYPDLVTSRTELSDRSIDTTSVSGRTLLRFSNGIANIGAGALELRAGVVEGERQKVHQRIYTTHGTYYSRLAGYMSYHRQHGHMHFEDFAHYKLRTVVGTSGIGPIVADSDKVSFCLFDDSVYNSRLSGFSWRRRYTTCGNVVQGISVGWKDVYGKSLAGQFIDITDVIPGKYWLESTADPRNQIAESNNSNNTTRVMIEIRESFIHESGITVE